MSYQSDLSVWEARWETLGSVIDDLLVQLEDPADWGVPRAKTLLAVVQSLQAFAEAQIAFFREGFGEDGAFDLMPSADFPQEYVFRTTLDQVGHDVALLEQIVRQRLSSRRVQVDGEEVGVNDRLNQADQLAQLALEPAVQAGLVGKTAVITYFHKSPAIRVVPYAPVAFVAIPYSSLNSDRDLLAIPHEVGHHIYRHGPELRHVLEQRIPKQPAWRRRWLEEIFADVYGAMVAGPALALSFQDLLLGKAVAEFVTDDGDHPVSFLRPFIYHEVLRQMTEDGHDFAALTAVLEAMWQEALEIRGLPESFVPLEGETAVSVAEARTYLTYAIAQIMKQMPDGVDPWFVAGRGDLAHELYANFADMVAMLTDRYADVADPKVHLYELDVQDGMVGVAEGLMALNKVGQVNGGGPGVLAAMPTLGEKRPLGRTSTWVDQIKDKAFGEGSRVPGDERIALPPEVWTAVLSTDGWNTGGPDGRWHG